MRDMERRKKLRAQPGASAADAAADLVELEKRRLEKVQAKQAQEIEQMLAYEMKMAQIREAGEKRQQQEKQRALERERERRRRRIEAAEHRRMKELQRKMLEEEEEARRRARRGTWRGRERRLRGETAGGRAVASDAVAA